MNRQFDIVIVGAGMVGLAAAGLLAREERLRISVIDAGPKPEFAPDDEPSLRVSAISPGSMGILAGIGVWPGIRETRACPYREMKVWDAGGSVEGPEALSFDAAEFAVPELGYIVENELIRHALEHSLEDTGVEVRFDTTIESIERTGHRFEIALGYGETVTPDLLIGADGARSFVRSCAGIAVRSWPHAQRAFVTCLETSLGHRHTAWQRFLRDGPIGLLPLADGRVSIVWSTTPEMAAAALEMPTDELSATLTEITEGVLGRLTPVGPRGAFPLKSQHAAAYVQDGLALIGDAAHTVHPLAGQGVNLGFADAAALAKTVLATLASDENPGDLPALRRYERARKGDNKTMLRFMDALNRLFASASAPLARARGAGMFLFNKSGPLRQRVVQTALGLR